MEKTACYPRAMSGRRRAGSAAILVAAALAALSAACGNPRSAFLAGGKPQRAELSELFRLLDASGSDYVQRFAILRQISSDLMAQEEYGRLCSLLTSVAGGGKDASAGQGAKADPYGSWYLFTLAYAYDRSGSAPVAAIYYDRVLKDWPDATVDGRSLHYACLSRLIEIVDSPERRIEYYKDMIARFPSEAETGSTQFLLGKEYERVGDWAEAIKAYSRFIPYFGAGVPGYPDAYRYARDIVDFYNSPKDWAYADLGDLVSRIKAALAAGDSYRLKSYRAKVSFFAVDWLKRDAADSSPALFDFGEFMSGGKIRTAEELDPASSGREAFLKTWGWTDKISTWYFYFRKVYFPADPEIHGRWEWAGIYYGEKMR
jgi:tetratricopeptide (TPR) repeat protein